MYKINISIDDVSPHPRSSVKVIDRCFDLIREFKNIKFTLFVPAAYWRTIKPGTATNQPLFINHYKGFCDFLLELPKKNFEIGYHGFFHGIPGQTDNDEFWHLNYEQSLLIFKNMFEVVNAANLKDTFSPIFRPPAWRMSPEAITAARDVGFEILALSPKEYAKKIYNGAEDKFGDIVYFTCNPPWDELQLEEKTEVVYHACEWDKNYLGEERSGELVEFLQKNQNKIDFCFMKEML